MDINFLRSIMTVVLFVAFLGIIAWSYSKNRGQAFEEAAALPLQGEGSQAMSLQGGRNE